MKNLKPGLSLRSDTAFALITLTAGALLLGAAATPQNAEQKNSDSETTAPKSDEDKNKAKEKTKEKPMEKIVKTEEEWKKTLTPEQFNVLRKKGTERAFSGEHKSHDKGIYKCAGCGLELFSSEAKFDSGTGWPSFFKPLEANRVQEESDTTYGMTRVEALCARCDGHLGHVFDDGPQPTGLRYCMNSVSLKFEKQP